MAKTRKKELLVMPFAALKDIYQVRQHANTCRFEGAKGTACPPGDKRTVRA